jgi:hypothetical protein
MVLDIEQPISDLNIQLFRPPPSTPKGSEPPQQQVNLTNVPLGQIAFDPMYDWDMSDLDLADASSNFLTEAIGGSA